MPTNLFCVHLRDLTSQILLCALCVSVVAFLASGCQLAYI